MIQEDTLPKLFKRNYERFGNRVIALRVKDRGIWKEYSWADYYQNVKHLSLYLIKTGLGYGDKVAIMGENKPETYQAEIATMAARAVAIGIFTDCSPAEVKYFVELCDIKIFVVHDQEQVDKLFEIKDEIPQVKRVIYWDPKGLLNYNDPWLISMDEALKIGRQFELDFPGEFERNIEIGKPEDIAIICVTSGTTAEPKAAMLSQGGRVLEASSLHEMDHFSGDDNYFSLVSIAWAAEQSFGIGASLYSAFPVNFPERAETVQENIRELGPSIILFGPKQWESIYRTVQSKILNSTWVKKKFFNLIVPVGRKMVELRLNKKKPRYGLKLLNFLASWLAFRPLKDNIGLSKVRVAYTAGSRISPEIIFFFLAIGINLKQAYGSSEMSLMTSHRTEDIRPETSGVPVLGAQICLSEEGEIMAKNRAMFVGYYKNQAATDEMLKNGWYRSGDYGYIDENGQLIVIDRMNDIKLLKGGKKFSPQHLEARLRFNPYIKEALVVYSEEYGFANTVISVDLDNVGHWAESREITYTSRADLSQKDEVLNLIQNEIKKVNATLPEESRLKKFICLDKEFDPDEGELTRTRKIRRSYLEGKYKELIGSLYSDKDTVELEIPIVYRDGRCSIMKRSLKVTSL